MISFGEITFQKCFSGGNNMFGTKELLIVLREFVLCFKARDGRNMTDALFSIADGLNNVAKAYRDVKQTS